MEKIKIALSIFLPLLSAAGMIFGAVQNEQAIWLTSVFLGFVTVLFASWNLRWLIVWWFLGAVSLSLAIVSHVQQPLLLSTWVYIIATIVCVIFFINDLMDNI